MKPTSKELAHAWNSATDEEAERWSERLEWLHTEYGADCLGCDSGDQLGLVEAKIRQAIEAVRLKSVLECYQIAASCEAGYCAAAIIKDTFGLEL